MKDLGREAVANNRNIHMFGSHGRCVFQRSWSRTIEVFLGTKSSSMNSLLIVNNLFSEWRGEMSALRLRRGWRGMTAGNRPRKRATGLQGEVEPFRNDAA